MWSVATTTSVGRFYLDDELSVDVVIWRWKVLVGVGGGGRLAGVMPRLENNFIWIEKLELKIIKAGFLDLN